MPLALAVEDIRSYLRDTGWRREERLWHDASIWSDADGHEILVPPRDDLADAEPRVREIIGVLSRAERRPPAEIAADINAPLADVQTFRTIPDDVPSGYTSLPAGLRALQGIRDLVGLAARTVFEGPRAVYAGGTPRPVGELLRRVQLGPARSGSYVFTVRVPVDRFDADGVSPQPPPGRQVTRLMYEAVSAVQAATGPDTDGDPRVFDALVPAGVSANMCEALSELAGAQRRQPFDVAFRWGRGHPDELPASTVRFGEGAGRVVRSGAARLRRLGASGAGTVTGVVESLHDQPDGADRWRIKVRGTMTMADGRQTARSVWVRLDGQASYDRAIVAHRTHKRIRAGGGLSELKGRFEMLTTASDLEILD